MFSNRKRKDQLRRIDNVLSNGRRKAAMQPKSTLEDRALLMSDMLDAIEEIVEYHNVPIERSWWP